MLERYRKNPEMTRGVNNPFYGKKHSAEARKKISSQDQSYKKTLEFAKLTSKGMNGNTNRKPVYDCWVDKYGKDEADRLDAIRKEKWSRLATGSNNNMYGRPSPQGSGNGWKGWYRNIYFRSLRELSWMIDADANNLTWRTMENAEDSISYIDPITNSIKNYFPDFFVYPNLVVECKPIRLWNTPTVSEKAFQSLYSCFRHGWTYKLVDPKIIDKESLIKLIDSGTVKMAGDYEDRVRSYV